MININAQIIFIAAEKLIAIRIVFHILYQCVVMSKITLNIILHCSICNGLLRHFIPYWLHMININAQITGFSLLKLKGKNCCISQMIPMWHYVRNHFKYNITRFYLYKISNTCFPIMIAYDKHQCKNHFFALQKLITITIVFIKS